MQPVKYSYSEYSNLFNTLRGLCKESNIEFDQIEETKFLQNQDNPEVRKALEENTTYDFETLVKKVKVLTKNKLAIYEAAKRSGEPFKRLAVQFLDEWAEKLDEKVVKKLGEEVSIRVGFRDFDRFNNRIPPSGLKHDEIDQRVRKIFGKIQFPKFQEVQQSKNDICGKLDQLLSKHIVFLKFQGDEPVTKIPQHAFQVVWGLLPTSHEKYLIEQYKHLLTGFSIGELDRGTMADSVIELYLKRFTELEKIDLSNCIKLSPACLSGGHPNIKSIILTGTAISPKQVNLKLFPKLKFEEIICEKTITSLDLKGKGLRTNWEEFSQKVNAADVIFSEEHDLDLLRETYAKNPSSEGFRGLITIINNYDKFKLLPGSCIVEIFISTFFNVWRQTNSSDWQNSKCHGREIHDFFLRPMLLLSTKQRTNIREVVSTLIQDQLAEELSLCIQVPMSHHSSQTRDEVKSILESDFHRIRYLASTISSGKFEKYGSVCSKLKGLIEQQENVLFSTQKVSEYSKIAGLNREVATFALMCEVYTTMSHVIECSTSPFLKLGNPATILKRPPTVFPDRLDLMAFNLVGAIFQSPLKPGPLYGLATDHYLACAFSMRTLNPKLRGEFLLKLSDRFSAYTSTSTAYPLAKVILGVVDPSDIPACDADSPLCSKLLAYQGVFSEGIDDAVKSQFWKLLCEGKLGGVSKGLIDAFVAFYKKEGTTEQQRNEICVAIKNLWGVWEGLITGINYHNFFSADKSYAANKLSELREFSKGSNAGK